MYIKTFKKIKSNEKPQFSMPLSLRIIRILSNEHIDWHGFHFIDILSLYYAIMIDKANEYLKYERQQKLQKRGISEVRQATMEDFDKL